MVEWGVIVGFEIGMIFGMLIGAYNFGKLTRNKFLRTKKGEYTFVPKEKDKQ